MKTRFWNLWFCLVLLSGLIAGSPAALPAAADAPAAPAAPPAALPVPAAPQNGVLNLVHIPFGNSASVDGKCSEYAAGASFSFTDGGGSGTVYLLNDGSSLYVCMQATTGSLASRFASLYLDPQANGATYTFAQQDDYALRVNVLDGVRSSYVGSGVANGYVDTPTLNPNWSGAASHGTNDVVEYAVPLKNFNIPMCGLFGLAVYHHWFAAVGNDYGWPSSQWYDQPRTWQLAVLDGSPTGQTCSSGKIAYVFRGNTLAAASFFNTLAAAGYTVDLWPLADVSAASDFSSYSLIMVADDTGSLDAWGSSGLTTDQVGAIQAANRPIIGLGEGGYAFFGRMGLPLGWPYGWHGPQSQLEPGSVSPSWFIGMTLPAPYTITSQPENTVGLYKPAMPAGVELVGFEVPPDNHAWLAQQGCRLLWGSGGAPLGMTADGLTLLLTAVAKMTVFQCPAENPPSKDCFIISKSASPVAPGPVAPGDMIDYAISASLTSAVGINCPKSLEATVIDEIPAGTVYLPGSAFPAAAVPAPAPDGTLNWPLTLTTSPQVIHFKVAVDQSACNTTAPLISNTPLLRPSGAADVTGSTVTHTVSCAQPVRFPSSDPFYAESELSIEPYPLRAGTPTRLSVRIRNPGATSQLVTAHFQAAPSAPSFGIGLPYADLPLSGNPVTATVPAYGDAVLALMFTPTFSGNFCLQVSATTASAPSSPMLTQRCIDALEDLNAHRVTPDTLSIPVRNPTGAAANVDLVVENTCPGFIASVTPTTLSLAAYASGTATLSVTAPASGLIGAGGCHIDVQAWIGSQLVGGIRKLNQPPVALPHSDVPWEEPELSLRPDPPVVGSPGQICIRLTNPLSTARSVSVDFSVADFGAGVPFTPAASLPTFSLPANSSADYCAPWTPAASGTLHRCILAELHQEGYADQRSQRNIDVVRAPTSSSIIPFVVGNPHLVAHLLTFNINLVGFPPPWHVAIEPLGGSPGDPPPAILLAGQVAQLQARLSTAAGDAAQPNPQSVLPFHSLQNGSQQSAEITVLLDGEAIGGLSLHFPPYQVNVPFMQK